MLLSDRDRDDARHAACCFCGHEWLLAEDWWVSVVGGIVPQHVDERPATALP